MPSVSKSQDAFKLKTLEAMARGGDPYGEASQSVNAAESDALAGQAGDTVATRGPVPERIAGDINASMLGSSDAVGNYLGSMQAAQAKHDQVFRQASAGYTPPPIYSTGGSGSGGGAGGGFSEDDLGLKPMPYDDSVGGGWRYGGFRTGGEGKAAVRGAAIQQAMAMQAEDEKLAYVAAIAKQRAGQARKQAKRPQQVKGPVRPVMSEGGINRAEEGKAIRFAPMGPRPGLGSHTQATRVDDRAQRAQAVMDNMRAIPVARRVQQLAQEAPVRAVLNATQPIRTAMSPEMQAMREARGASDDYFVPEDWELQQQAAGDFGWNPYIAAGEFMEPTAQERNAQLRAELEYGERGQYGGYKLSELNAQDKALMDATYGADVVDTAGQYDLTPDQFLAINSDPVFQDGQALAAETYETTGDMEAVEEALLLEGYDATQIQMILDQYEGLGLSIPLDLGG